MTIDREFNIIKAIHGTPDGMTRRTLMQLASAAGISLAMTPAVVRVAEAANIVRGKLASVGLTLAIDYWALWSRTFEEVSADLQVQGVEYWNEADPARLMTQVRGMPAASIQTMCGYVYPDGALPAVTKICQELGIYFGAVWDAPAWFTPPDIGDYYVSFLTPNSVKETYEVAKILFNAIGGEGKVAWLAGQPGLTSTYRLKGFMQAAAEFPGVQVLEGWRADWEREKARNSTISILAAHPDIKAIFAAADDMAFGVLAVLRERKLDSIKVAAIVGLPEGLTEIAKGEHFIATASDLPPYMCGYSAVAAFDALNGWKPMLGERMVHFESILITPENAAAVNEKVYAANARPFDWVKMSRTLNPDSWDPQLKITAIEPDIFWEGMDGKDRLNPMYEGAKEKGEFDKVNALYAEHYKSGPNKA